MRRSFLLTLSLGIAGPAGLAGQPATPAPVDGRAVLRRMHDAYAGKWDQSVAFVQKTTLFRPGGVRDSATWYESIKGPNLLRIVLGDPAAGRGVVYTAESSFVFRDGKLASSAADGNPFLPLIMGVYLQPVEETERQLAHHDIDASKAYRTTVDGRPALVVGAAAESDSLATRFWVDEEKLIVLRMRTAPSGNRPSLDVRLLDYVKLGSGWFGTTIRMSAGGSPRQNEDYLEWSEKVDLPDALFSRTEWTTTGDWATGKRPASLWKKRP
jgi:outer membrane lipoprotein-sorting protein